MEQKPCPTGSMGATRMRYIRAHFLPRTVIRYVSRRNNGVARQTDLSRAESYWTRDRMVGNRDPTD